MYQLHTEKQDIVLEIDYYQEELVIILKNYRIGRDKTILKASLKELENISAAMVLFKAMTQAIKENVKDVAI